MQTQIPPVIVRPNEAPRLELRGEIRHQLLAGAQTGGALALAHSQFQAGVGAPLHAHTREDEWFWIERGQFHFQIGDQTHSLNAGDCVFAPRGVPHSYRCEDDDGGALLVGVVGAGFENFFRELADLLPDAAQTRVLAARYGIAFDGFDALDAPALAPQIVRAGEGECLEAFGDRTRVIISTEQSGGAFCLVENETPSFSGPPPHLHEREDEVFFIRAGRYEFGLGDARAQAEAGDVVFAPRGVPHTFRVVSGEPGRALILATPGGFDLFFGQCARLFQSDDATPERVVAIGATHGLQFLAPDA